MSKGNYKLIFEGAELTGKSSIMGRIYDFLEKKYNTNPKILDGCHWFNSDVGIFGTKYGKDIIEKYVEMAELMPERNIMFEKLHISDMVYHNLYKKQELDYSAIEERLLKLNTKIIFCSIEDDPKIFEKRLGDRLNLYNHYGRIAQKPSDYVEQQKKFREFITKSKLPVLNVDLTTLPNERVVKEILTWIGETQ
ncbi:MAG: hypothetical protein AAB534_01335 [Patescibacteria group bacterium]